MYEELKKLAANATQGPWVAAGPSFGSDSPQYCEEVLVDRAGDEDDTYTVCQAPTGLEKESTADMEFIAAANPSAVLALIANLEKIDADRKACWAEFKVQGSYIRELQAENNELIADGESNSSQLSGVLAERDRLQLVLFDRNAEIEALRKECARLAEDNRAMLENPEDLL